MRLSYFFIVAAVLSLLFGLAAVLIPEQFLLFYGANTDAVGTLALRLFGGNLLGLTVLYWLARNAEQSPARNAILPAGLFETTLGTVVTLFAQLAGVLNSLGWINVIVYLLLALGFGYFLIPRTTTSTVSSTAP